MPNTLTGAVISGDSITATYTDGTPGSSSGPWPSAVTDAAASLRSAVDTALGATATTVQIYTAASNPDEASNASAGDIVDAWDGSGGNPDMRFGEAASVPSAVANARDALKSALSAAI